MLMSLGDALRGRLGIARGLAVVVAVAMIGWLLRSAFEPLRLNWGDPWSDANVLTALNYSSKYGFIQTSFTDILDVGPLTKDSYRYTHYPPFAEIFYGCVRKIAGGIVAYKSEIAEWLAAQAVLNGGTDSRPDIEETNALALGAFATSHSLPASGPPRHNLGRKLLWVAAALLIFIFNGTLWCLGVAAFAASAAGRIRQSGRVLLWIDRALGGLFVYLGVRIAMFQAR